MGVLKSLELGKEDQNKFGDGEGELEAIILSTTTSKEILRTLNQHIEESEEQRRKLFSSMEDRVEYIGKQLETALQDQLSRTEEKIDLLSERVENLESIVDRLHQEKVEREMYESLNEELARYRDSWFFENIKPAVKGLITFYDDVERVEEAGEGWKERILEILKRLNVEKIKRTSKEYNTEFQEAIEYIETENKEEDLQVTEVLGEGFKYLDRIIRPQQVAIYTFSQPEEGDNREGRDDGS